MSNTQPKNEEVKQRDFENFKKEFELLMSSYQGIKIMPDNFTWLNQKICDFSQYRIVVSPVWVATNHGTFELQQQYSIGELPKQQA